MKLVEKVGNTTRIAGKVFDMVANRVRPYNYNAWEASAINHGMHVLNNLDVNGKQIISAALRRAMDGLVRRV